MLNITNIRVYDLKESVIACRNAMRTTPPEYTEEEFEKSLERARKLVEASRRDPKVKCHDNFLTGIRVSFDIVYPQYISPELQRYHFIDIVTSSSKMHRLMKMNLNEACNKYVDKATMDACQWWIDKYNAFLESDGASLNIEMRDGEILECRTRDEALYALRMKALSNCPLGLELFMRVSTNYKQLQTIYHQRVNHRLKEDWGVFCRFIEGLPCAEDFITGKMPEKNETSNQ